MTVRTGHYTALLETMSRRAAELHADEREQLLAVADTLIFGDPDSEQGLAQALDLIARLRESERWSAKNCAELRQHLHGCGPLPAGHERGRRRASAQSKAEVRTDVERADRLDEQDVYESAVGGLSLRDVAEASIRRF